MKGRAVRRHHIERLRRKRSRYNAAWAGDEKTLGIVTNTPARCSCPMCGNPRRHFGQRTAAEVGIPHRQPIDDYLEATEAQWPPVYDDFGELIGSGLLCFESYEEQAEFWDNFGITT